ncbi:hypothetical protein WJX84_001276 [Apatococcus fuscideae]|uniref:Uncharacterized protein n=1 Tax=Apatococcus fuscideae TaxID=2026836 RepID=A0AAW1SZ25_9CHLO
MSHQTETLSDGKDVGVLTPFFHGAQSRQDRGDDRIKHGLCCFDVIAKTRNEVLTANSKESQQQFFTGGPVMISAGGVAAWAHGCDAVVLYSLPGLEARATLKSGLSSKCTASAIAFSPNSALVAIRWFRSSGTPLLQMPRLGSRLLLGRLVCRTTDSCYLLSLLAGATSLPVPPSQDPWWGAWLPSGEVVLVRDQFATSHQGSPEECFAARLDGTVISRWEMPASQFQVLAHPLEPLWSTGIPGQQLGPPSTWLLLNDRVSRAREPWYLMEWSPIGTKLFVAGSSIGGTAMDFIQEAPTAEELAKLPVRHSLASLLPAEMIVILLLILTHVLGGLGYLP